MAPHPMRLAFATRLQFRWVCLTMFTYLYVSAKKSSASSIQPILRAQPQVAEGQ
jgi:hypothetical protein